MLTIAIFLFLLGLGFGSFVNALVWRLHEQQSKKPKTKKSDLSILTGRSICPNCRHTLSALDLVPVISWMLLRGRCRYCGRPISKQYPAVELATGFIFALSYIFWPLVPSFDGQWLLLATWLACSVGLMALAVYDIRWMILPNRIIYPTLAIAIAGRLGYITAYEPRPGRALGLWALSAAIASGIFYILFLVSQGKWIGFGDVRLGLITGTLLAHPYKSFAMIFIASLLGILSVLPSLFAGRKSLTSKTPYGPFLIAATGIMVIFGDSLINGYKSIFGL
jgi:prepilin signal peptidase PulO-like enzyme (type II secretory pathway)